MAAHWKLAWRVARNGAAPDLDLAVWRSRTVARSAVSAAGCAPAQASAAAAPAPQMNETQKTIMPTQAANEANSVSAWVISAKMTAHRAT